MLQRALCGVAALLAAVALFGLRAEVRAVPHRAAVLASGAPAIVYEPASAASATARIPVVVLAHGLAGNAHAMASLARRIARAGYGVVTFDFHGHGAHPAPIPGTTPGTREAALRKDFDAALILARTQSRFDPERIALAGHSMGGSAAMDAASFDAGVLAVVAISGSRHWNGPYAPSNLMLIWASGDPQTTRRQAEKLAAERAGLQQVVLDRLYGNLAQGTAVKASEVDGTNHLSIVYSADAAARIVGWLARALGPGAAAEPVAADGRLLWCALGGAASLALIWGLLGALSGFVPRIELPAARSPVTVCAAFTLALCAGIALAGGSDPELSRGPFGFMPLVGAREVIGALACAGLPLFAWGVQRGDISFGPLRDAATWATALFVALGSSLLLGVFVEPLGLASPTLPRLLWSGLSALLLLPFFASSEFLLRSEGRAGRWLPALARLVALLVFFVAAALGALPETAQLAVFALAPLFVGFEVAAQRLARRAPHPWLSALLQSAWASGVLCASAPLVG